MSKATASQLDALAKEVAHDQEAIDSQSTDTRKRVLAMGRKLRQMQKVQKKEQQEAKAAGEGPQTWKEWCDEQKRDRVTFPHDSQIRRYVLIARYPKAFANGMSIKEAYKEAGRWKKNGGNPPLPMKKVTPKRLLARLASASSPVQRKLDKATDSDLRQIAEEEGWTTDEIDGCMDELLLLRQSLNAVINQIRSVQQSWSAST